MWLLLRRGALRTRVVDWKRVRERERVQVKSKAKGRICVFV